MRKRLKRVMCCGASLSMLSVNTLVADNATSGADDSIAEEVIVETQKNTGKMEWFSKARLGVMVCWGAYSVRGIDESWSFFNQYLTYDEYMSQLKGFTASNYSPEKLVGLIKESGARYAMMTAKHHDGIALWDTKANDLSTVKKSAAKRDVLTPFVEHLRKSDLKVGMYYSLMDWSHPDFPVKNRRASKGRDNWEYNPSETPERWDAFMDFNFKQYSELAKAYNPDLWWFDGQWWFSKKEWRSDETAKLIYKHNSSAIINSRLPGYGDYLTPEQGVPLVSPKVPWEVCMTINGSWGYQAADTNYKSSHDVIRILADCTHMGGNLLLSVGLKADGSIPQQQVEVLKGLGRWTQKHEVAIYDTNPGIPLYHYNGPSALGTGAILGAKRGGQDILYLFVPHKPNGSIRLKGVLNQVERAWVVGNGVNVKWRQDGSLKHPGIYYFNIPQQSLDKDVTVLAVLLDGKIKLQKP